MAHTHSRADQLHHLIAGPSGNQIRVGGHQENLQKVQIYVPLGLPLLRNELHDREPECAPAHTGEQLYGACEGECPGLEHCLYVPCNHK